MFVDVSAREGLNISGLLEAVVLTADAALDLSANPDMAAQGIAIEAHLDRGRGPVATVLIQRGTLRVGDSVVAGPAYGRVRALLDDHGQNVLEAPPSYPVQVLGLTSVPGAATRSWSSRTTGWPARSASGARRASATHSWPPGPGRARSSRSWRRCSAARPTSCC